MVRGSGATTKPLFRSTTSSVTPPLSVQVTTGFAALCASTATSSKSSSRGTNGTGQRLRALGTKLVLVDPSAKGDAGVVRSQSSEALRVRTRACDPQLDPDGYVGLGLDQQVDALGAVEPARGEQRSVRPGSESAQRARGRNRRRPHPGREVALPGRDPAGDGQVRAHPPGLKGIAVEPVVDVAEEGAGNAEGMVVTQGVEHPSGRAQDPGRAPRRTRWGRVDEVEEDAGLRLGGGGLGRQSEEVIRVVEAAEGMEHVDDVAGMAHHPARVLGRDHEVEAGHVEVQEALVAVDQLAEGVFGRRKRDELGLVRAGLASAPTRPS